MKKIGILVLITLFLVTMSVLAGPNCGADHNEEKAAQKAQDHSGHNHSDGSTCESEKEHDEDEDHSGHDHSDGSTCDDHKDHKGDGHDEKDKDGHDHSDGSSCGSGDTHDHEESGHIELTPKMIKQVGITESRVINRSVTSYVTVPGEVKINEDNLTHINPLYPSKCVKVFVRQGQYVKKGDLLATLTNLGTLSGYSIKAPMSGRIITKHLSNGEVVNEEDLLFSIANLGTVWAEFAVPLDRLSGIPVGSSMKVSLLGHEEESISGRVIFIDPLSDPETRRVMVRALLSNSGNAYRPGSYVTARIDYGDPKPVSSVEIDAIQTVGGQEMIFVPAEDEEGAFKPIEVRTGRRSSHFVEIVSGLSEGDAYVNKGAFALKAEMVTANMDPHAGHNH